MEKKPTPNGEFEDYLRKQLQEIDASPDEGLWADISQKQSKLNLMLKLRHYALPIGAAAMMLLVSVGLWQWNLQNNENKVLVNPEQPQLIAHGPEGQPVVAPPNPATGLDGTTQTGVATRKNYALPNFSSRPNAVPVVSVRFDVGKGIEYVSPSTGTKVSIPAASLVTISGKAATGEAELYFREYRSITEYLSAGLPMHYSDERGDYSFNSGGMFEVRVAQHGEALSMADGHTYDVAFSATTELEKASLYYLEDKTGEWIFKPDAAFGQIGISQPPVASEPIVISNNLRKKKENCRPEPYELSVEPELQEFMSIGVNTGLELASKKLEMPTWFKKNPWLNDDQLLFRLERGLVQLKQHRDLEHLFFPEDLDKFFTELSAFKGCYFSYNMDSTGGMRRTRYLNNSDYWQRITVTQEEGEKCIVTLYDGKEGQMQFHAILTGSTENKNFNAEKVLSEYRRLRTERQQNFAEKNKALRYFLFASSAFKTDEEWCMNVIDWLEYFEKNRAMMARLYADLLKQGIGANKELTQKVWKDWKYKLREHKFDLIEGQNLMVASKNNLTYSLRLSDFGTYNCDQIFRMSTEFFTVFYKTSDGKNIIPAFVNVLERKTKLFFTLPSVNLLVYCPKRDLDIIVTDRDGRQYHLPGEKYAAEKINKNEAAVLTLKDVTEQTKSPREWANLLEI